jgi:uncharacterized protein YndB with AHSA1/START domain/catechol 2,3-dioxygenase-like lactoylglutathione lyase family enzyme
VGDAPPAQVIEIARVYAAPRAVVWDAWTDPAQIARWWGKRGWNTPPASVEIDLRPGGVFRLDSVSEADGTVMQTDGVIRELARPERLVFATADGDVATVTFADVGGGRTEMVFRVEVTMADDMRRRAEGGLNSAFDRLGEELGAFVDFRLEVVVVPVSDVDRAKAFYSRKLGFTVDHDAEPSPGMRVVQLTPRGSGCSIAIGTGIATMAPGSLEGLQLVVSDMDAARAELLARGVELGDVRTLGREGHPGFRFTFFTDPDGNGWAIQEIKT